MPPILPWNSVSAAHPPNGRIRWINTNWSSPNYTSSFIWRKRRRTANEMNSSGDLAHLHFPHWAAMPPWTIKCPSSGRCDWWSPPGQLLNKHSIRELTPSCWVSPHAVHLGPIVISFFPPIFRGGSALVRWGSSSATGCHWPADQIHSLESISSSIPR